MEQTSQPQSFGAALVPRRVALRRRTIEAPGVNETGMQRTPMKGWGKRIYAWPIVGGTSVAGMHAKYTVLLWSTGEISCDCPGWINYHSKKGELACKHVKLYDASRQQLFRMWQNHEELPVATQERDTGVEVETPFNPNQPTPRDSKIILGRVIDIS